MKRFTGNKDVDYKIMMELDDESLLNFCQTDRYIKSICEDDNFWLRRSINRYGETVSKPYNKTWKEHYLFLINHYNVTRKYVDSVVTIHVEKNFRALDEYIQQAKSIYNEEYSGYYVLKSDEEIREIIGNVVAEAVIFHGILILEHANTRINIFEDGNIFGTSGGKDSILIFAPNPNKHKLAWSNNQLEHSKREHKYLDLTNVGYVTLDHGFNDNYIYVPSLRVAGHQNDIIDHFLMLGVRLEEITAHVNRSYNISNIDNVMKNSYEQELRELEEYKVLGKLPTIPALPFF